MVHYTMSNNVFKRSTINPKAKVIPFYHLNKKKSQKEQQEFPHLSNSINYQIDLIIPPRKRRNIIMHPKNETPSYFSSLLLLYSSSLTSTIYLIYFIPYNYIPDPHLTLNHLRSLRCLRILLRWLIKSS